MADTKIKDEQELDVENDIDVESNGSEVSDEMEDGNADHHGNTVSNPEYVSPKSKKARTEYQENQAAKVILFVIYNTFISHLITNFMTNGRKQPWTAKPQH